MNTQAKTPLYYRLECDPETGAFALSCASEKAGVVLSVLLFCLSREEALRLMGAHLDALPNAEQFTLHSYHGTDHIYVLTKRMPFCRLLDPPGKTRVFAAMKARNNALLAKHRKTLLTPVVGKHYAIILPARPSLTSLKKAALLTLGRSLARKGLTARVYFTQGGIPSPTHPLLLGIKQAGGQYCIVNDRSPKAFESALLIHHCAQHKADRHMLSSPIATQSALDYSALYYDPKCRSGALCLINLAGGRRGDDIVHVGGWVSTLSKYTQTPYFCSEGIALHQTLRLLPKQEKEELPLIVAEPPEKSNKFASLTSTSPFL